MRHPFELVPEGKLRLLFLPALAAYAGLQTLFALLDIPLRTPAAPNGVVSFELAGSAFNARAILDAWNGAARADAAFGLGLDYLFMVAYSTLIGAMCVWAGRTLKANSRALAGLGGPLAWGLWLAVLFDGSENIGLLAQLMGGPTELAAQVAAVCAGAKFLLIGAGLVYTGTGMIAFTSAKLSGRQKAARV